MVINRILEDGRCHYKCISMISCGVTVNVSVRITRRVCTHSSTTVIISRLQPFLLESTAPLLALMSSVAACECRLAEEMQEVARIHTLLILAKSRVKTTVAELNRLRSREAGLKQPAKRAADRCKRPRPSSESDAAAALASESSISEDGVPQQEALAEAVIIASELPQGVGERRQAAIDHAEMGSSRVALRGRSKLPRPLVPVCWACWRRLRKADGGPKHSLDDTCLKGSPTATVLSAFEEH